MTDRPSPGGGPGPDAGRDRAGAANEPELLSATVRLHHVNLGYPPGGEQDEIAFLTEVLDFRRVPAPPEFPTARWFEDESGLQIHLSEDPGHRPADMAHVAVVLGDMLETVTGRLEDRGVPTEGFQTASLQAVTCRDPAGNRWELRSTD